MKHKIHIAILFLLLCELAWCQTTYRPGDVVPEPYLKVYGCEAFFSCSALTDEQKTLMDGCSYKQDGVVGWEQLRYLCVLHRDAEGNAIVGEMVCSALISNDLLEIFKALYLASYPIESMRLVDYFGGDDESSMRENNTSCFNQRAVTAGGRLSKHSFGLAVDINPKYNPYHRERNGKSVVRPEGSADYLDREEDFPYKITKGDLCYRLFRQHGFQWGGDWGSGKDYQHFER